MREWFLLSMFERIEFRSIYAIVLDHARSLYSAEPITLNIKGSLVS